VKKIIFASTKEGAGKTSIIAGIASATDKKYGYMKPFGDRLIYRKKKNSDYDASLMVDIFDLGVEPENISLGFDHSKLKYVYDETKLKTTLDKMIETSGKDKDFLIIEAGKTLSYGASINLDAISLSKITDAKLVIVVSGDDDDILDDIEYLKNHVNLEGIDFAGIIINKVNDLEDFKNTYSKTINEMGINILGIIPRKEQLTKFSIKYLSEMLFAKVLAGEKGLNKSAENIFVGAMSTDESLKNPLFNKPNKLLITSGDRNDMILAALDSNSAGIILTNNLMPPANILSRASESGIPIMLVSNDTLSVAKQIDRLEALLTKDEKDNIKLLGQMAEKHLNIDQLSS